MGSGSTARAWLTSPALELSPASSWVLGRVCSPVPTLFRHLKGRGEEAWCCSCSLQEGPRLVPGIRSDRLAPCRGPLGFEERPWELFQGQNKATHGEPPSQNPAQTRSVKDEQLIVGGSRHRPRQGHHQKGLQILRVFPFNSGARGR